MVDFAKMRQMTSDDRAEMLRRENERLREADAIWRQRYSLLESQIANCHKEMKRLREALLAAPSGSAT